MDSLFDQLKAAPPVNSKAIVKPDSSAAATETTTIAEKKSSKEITKSENSISSIRSTDDGERTDVGGDIKSKAKKKSEENSNVRRDSMPPPATTAVYTKTSNASKKSRSLSPPKDTTNIKQFKVLLERKKMSDDTKSPIKATIKKASGDNSKTLKRETDVEDPVVKNGEKSPKKAKITSLTTTPTPTKAQQKLFDPAVLVQAQQLTTDITTTNTAITPEIKVKRCKVLLMRKDLAKLQRQFKENAKNDKKKNKKLKKQKNAEKISPKNRQRSTSPSSPSPTKTGFYIKINAFTKSPKISAKSTEKSEKSPRGRPPKSTQSKPSPSIGSAEKSKRGRPPKSPQAKASPTMGSAEKSKRGRPPKSASPGFGSIAKRVNAAAAVSSTKPTKFTRTQLIRMYGKRVFCSRVRIERCSHPLMLIFESNARARRLQAKRSKSKNLSVSFREQVEIFGDSSDEGEEEGMHWGAVTKDTSSQLFPIDISGASTTFHAAAISGQAGGNPSGITATPARLKKVENGKVVDDIELDPSLFVAPTIASTPFPSTGRKKREKKSFSPLKGDGAPSPRKEKLKLANEKMPPSSLRRLTADEANEDDDEDDECEYIVPIEIPERRTSRTSSGNAADDDVNTRTDPEELPHTDLDTTPMDTSDISANISSINNSSGGSFASAIEQPLEKPVAYPQLIHNKDVAMENNTNGEPVDSSAQSQKNAIETVDGGVEEGRDGDESPAAGLPKLTPIDSVSPAQSFNSINDIVDSLIKNVHDEPSASDMISKSNSAAEDDILVPGQESENVDDGLSLQMFVDDDNTVANSTFLEDTAIKDSEIVDGIVQERMEEITKDNQLDSSNDASILNANFTSE